MASAADVYQPVYAPPPAPVSGWTGWYVGVNAGASFGNVKTDFNDAPLLAASIPVSPGFGFSNREYPDGFIGGGQIGYNWQVSPIWVVGLEADFQGALEKDQNTLTNNFDGRAHPTLFVVTGSTVLDYQTKIDWFGTVRGRIGYVWGNGDVMRYLTGGLAYGKVDVEGTSTVSGTIGGAPFSNVHAVGHSHVNAGWTAGYGTEGRLAILGWTWKIEGLWMDLGSINDTDVAEDCAPKCTATSTGGQTITHTHFKDGILRGGLNYKFY